MLATSRSATGTACRARKHASSGVARRGVSSGGARHAVRAPPRLAPPAAAAAFGGFPLPEGPADSNDADLSFYELLGVPPTADARQIKKAYHGLMREVHPDTMASATVDDAYYVDTNDLAALLNEIYDTLTDPDKRSTYDALVGFSAESVNPFYDTAFERDQVFVDEVSCIGCGKCVRACSGTFVIEASKYGRARVAAQPRGPDQQEDVQIAMETCPVDCIHWVSSPQLSLLETALSKMGRIDAFVMMRSGGGGNGDVFHEASKAWHRRQAAARARVQAAAGTTAAARGFGWTGPLGGVFNQHVDWAGAGDGRGGNGKGGGGGSEGADPRAAAAAGRIASLAARAAQSARLWRMATAMRGPAGALTD